ncbi:PAS domain-containing protein [Strongyloides ratti]|uniref:PAS domain-containing protein n=1 Tax=Strongyloides ratti TaxID=34506 RepID=A0A090L2R4_STRRB|nr:PAS domain-containing protein [Strongyloides ratti]CEF61739.1 PAS domain-containing protein [Strongyloides ratti]
MSLIPNQTSIFNLLEKENGKVIKNTIEKRRESSKCAARERRGKETCIFDELKYEVPVVNEATVTHVDRIALLRVAATLCRLRKNGSSLFLTSDNKNVCKNKYDSSLYNETSLYEILDGFILVIDSDDTILYSTESISMYLGLTQTDVVGHTLKEYCHSVDHSRLVNNIQSLRYDGTCKTSVCLRMKTVVSPRGRNLNLKSAIMKSTQCTIKCLRLSSGWLSLLYISTEPVGNGSITQNVTVLAKITHDEGNGTFVTRHTCDMRFSFVGENFNSLLKKDSRSMVGTSFYDLIHPADVLEVGTSIKNLFETGHVQTIYYRLIAPEDSLVYWMVTICNTVKHTSKGQKGQYVICMHYYLGSQKEDESYMAVRSSEVSHQKTNIPSKTNQLIYDVHDGNNDDDTHNTEANEENFIGLAPKFVECSDFILQSPCLPLFLEEDSIPNDFHDLFNNLLIPRIFFLFYFIIYFNNNNNIFLESSIKRKSSYKALLAYLINDEDEANKYEDSSIRTTTRRPFFTTSSISSPNTCLSSQKCEGASPDSVDSGFSGDSNEQIKQESTNSRTFTTSRGNNFVFLSDFYEQYQDTMSDDVTGTTGIFNNTSLYTNVSTPTTPVTNIDRINEREQNMEYDEDVFYYSASNTLSDWDPKGRAPFVSVEQITQLESDDSLLEFFLPTEFS